MKKILTMLAILFLPVAVFSAAIPVIIGGGGGGTGAPTSSPYITSSADPTLTNEKVLTGSETLTLTA